MRINKKTVIAGVAVLAAAGGAVLVANSANAAEPTPALRQTAAVAPTNSVYSGSIVDGQVGEKDLYSGFVKALYGVYNNTVTTPSIVKGAVTEDKLAPAVQAKLNAGGKDAINNLLYVHDGTKEVRSLTYKLTTPVNVEDFQATFFQEHVNGTGTIGAQVLLGVDANGDSKYTGKDLDWQMGGFKPADLNGDAVLQMDGVDPKQGMVDTSKVNQWYASKADGTGWDNGTYGSVSSVATAAKLTGKKVYTVRFAIGGSSSWTDEALRVSTLLNNQATLVNVG